LITDVIIRARVDGTYETDANVTPKHSYHEGSATIGGRIDVGCVESEQMLIEFASEHSITVTDPASMAARAGLGWVLLDGSPLHYRGF